MSNYTLYKYNNSAINIVIGDSFSYLENSSMNRTEIIAYQGMDNDYFFDVRNKDRKLQPGSGSPGTTNPCAGHYGNYRQSPALHDSRKVLFWEHH